VTGRAQIVSIPMTSYLAGRINYVNDVNANTYPDSSKASAYGGSTIPVISAAAGNNQSPNPNNPSIFYGTVTNDNQPLESSRNCNYSKVRRNLNHLKVGR
jgi:hypothetical protein